MLQNIEINTNTEYKTQIKNNVLKHKEKKWKQ